MTERKDADDSGSHPDEETTGAADRRPDAVERQALVGRLGVEPGLCTTCRNLRILASRRSTFVLCSLSRTDPRFPRYPRLPVVACVGFERTGSPERTGLLE